MGKINKKTLIIPYTNNWLQENNEASTIWELTINEKWSIPSETMSSNIKEDMKNSGIVIKYKKTVINLKSFIKDKGIANLHYIGKKNNIYSQW